MIWDLPTRLFHWLLVAAVVTSWASHELDAIELHALSGYSVLTLLIFRLGWGIFGSRTARFSDFVRSPRAVWAYLRGAAHLAPGHNPAGGWAVLVLLGLLMVQAMTGLYGNDDVLFTGPLWHTVDEDTAGQLGELHGFNFNLLLGMIALHLAAIAFYRIVRGNKLTQAMLRGHDPQRQGVIAPAPLARALLWALASIASVAALVSLG